MKVEEVAGLVAGEGAVGGVTMIVITAEAVVGEEMMEEMMTEQDRTD